MADFMILSYPTTEGYTMIVGTHGLKFPSISIMGPALKPSKVHGLGMSQKWADIELDCSQHSTVSIIETKFRHIECRAIGVCTLT